MNNRVLLSGEINNLKREIEALKSARIKAARTLAFKTWSGTVNFRVENYSPLNSIKVTITPTTDKVAMLTSIYSGDDDITFRTKRCQEGNNIVYYLAYASKQGDYPASINQDLTIFVRYSAPASIAIKLIDPVIIY